MGMEACQNSTLPSTSDTDVVVKDSNPIQIPGAEGGGGCRKSDSGKAAWCDWSVRSCAWSSSGGVRFFDGQFSSAGRGKSKPSAGELASVLEIIEDHG